MKISFEGVDSMLVPQVYTLIFYYGNYIVEIYMCIYIPIIKSYIDRFIYVCVRLFLLYFANYNS